MAILLIENRVPDFETWKQIFDSDPVGRKPHGVTRHWIYRQADDPNAVVVSLEFPSTDQAREFLNEPALQKAWKEAGAEQPQARVLEETESASY